MIADPSQETGGESPREFYGWIVLAVLFCLVLSVTMAGSRAPESSEVRLSESELALREVLAMTRSKNPADQNSRQEKLDELLGTVAKTRATDPVSAEIYAVSRTLEGRPVTAKDVAPMARSKSLLDRNAARIYASKTLSLSDARSLSSGFGKLGLVGDLMRAQALAKAGDGTALTALTASSFQGTFIGMLALALVGSGSLIAWLTVINKRLGGQLVPRGVPLMPRTLCDADRFALRASSLMALYLILSAGPQVLEYATRSRINPQAADLVTGAVMLIAVPLVFLRPVLGRIITLRDIGVQRQDLPRLAGLGLLGFLLEIPLSVALAEIGQVLFSGLHPATHPATVAVSTRHDPLTLIATLVMASIVAPFWEEIMFRGLLFPAISRVTSRIVVGALLSSFFFGALHPQGLPLWMALMAVAGMSCALSYYTKSLVPSMVMHAAHNTTLILLTILFS